MQHRDAIRRVLARLRELSAAPEYDFTSACERRELYARVIPLLAALAQAVVEAPRYVQFADGFLDVDEDGHLIDRTEAIDAALDSLAEEAGDA